MNDYCIKVSCSEVFKESLANPLELGHILNLHMQNAQITSPHGCFAYTSILYYIDNESAIVLQVF